MATTKDAEKKVKHLEAEISQLHEDLAASERARRLAENERDELLEESNNNSTTEQLIADERRRQEAALSALQEELEEEHVTNENLNEKIKKLMAQLDGMNSELANERSVVQKLESDKLTFDRQHKELKAKLNELETAQRTKTKTTITSLEAKIVQLEEMVEQEVREKQAANKNTRKMEKRIKEMQSAIEDEKRHADQFRDQVEKMQTRIKTLKRHLEEVEEECSREKASRRKVQREMEDTVEANEALTREVAALKNKLRYVSPLPDP
jgi:myosin protein heavy chain